MGFGYQRLVGELIYACVLYRCDIGYEITLLAKFNKRPAKLHYQALKTIAIYLRRTITWGIIYWRPHKNLKLPEVPFKLVVPETDLPGSPQDKSLFEPACYCDVAHGNHLPTAGSTTGYGGMLVGGLFM